LRHRDRELGLVMIYNYHLADATLRLAVNVENDVYRLLLSNHSRHLPRVLGLRRQGGSCRSLRDQALCPGASIRILSNGSKSISLSTEGMFLYLSLIDNFLSNSTPKCHRSYICVTFVSASAIQHEAFREIHGSSVPAIWLSDSGYLSLIDNFLSNSTPKCHRNR
jgi:hypothetical protein